MEKNIQEDLITGKAKNLNLFTANTVRKLAVPDLSLNLDFNSSSCTTLL